MQEFALFALAISLIAICVPNVTRRLRYELLVWRSRRTIEQAWQELRLKAGRK